MSFFRAVATISGLTLASRVFGLVRDVMAAAIMGAGPVADAFFVALRLPNFFRRMTAEGAFSVSFVPLFSKTYHQDGIDAAIEFSNQVLAIMLAILIPFSIIAIIFMPAVLHVLAPGFGNEGGRYALAVTLTRITFGYLLFMSLCAFVGGMLNSLDRFAIFAMAPVLFNVMQIICLGVAYMGSIHRNSVWSVFPTPGHALAWGVLSSGVLQLAWMVWGLRRNRVHLKLVRPVMTAQVKRLFQLMGPGIVGASAVQINLLVDTVIASTLSVGAVSYLYYADRLNQLPLGLIGTAMGTALLPKLAQKFAAGNPDESNHLFNRAVEWTLLLTLPAATALFVIATPIIATLFERGEFTPDATIATAHTLMAYAFGLPSFVVVKVLSTALYAQENTKTPVKVTLVCATLNIILCLALVYPLHHVGIALATAIAGWIQAGILTWLIEKKNHLDFDKTMKRNAVCIVAASVAMGIILAGCSYGFAGWFAAKGLHRMVALAVTMALGGTVYAGLILVLRVLDIKTIKQSLKGQV